MIALDSSALVAIAFGEPDADTFIRTIAGTDGLLIGAPTVLEVRLVLTGKLGRQDVDGAMEIAIAPHFRIVPFDEEHLAVAADAHRRFSGRPARLNFGDCMAYAVAKVAGCPLLYKGENFARTDIRSAVAA